MIFLIIWIVCGAFAYAICFAHVQAEFDSIAKEDYRKDMGMSILFGFLGIISLVVIFFATGFAEHRLKWK